MPRCCEREREREREERERAEDGEGVSIGVEDEEKARWTVHRRAGEAESCDSFEDTFKVKVQPSKGGL